MYLIYSLLLGAWVASMLPVFLYRTWRHGKYRQGLSQRFGRLPGNLRSDGRPTFWFHSCSVGETLSIQPVVNELHLRFPEVRFVFSTVTETGQALARQRFSSHGPENVFYFPVDFTPVCRHFLDWIRPTVIVIVDTEIWPNLLRQANIRGIPVVMANGRISPRSFRTYRFARSVMRKVLSNYSILLMQSHDDAERIRMIGAPPDKVIVSGNIKYDTGLVEQKLREETVRSLDEALGLASGDGDLIVAGSTHDGEEQILIEVLRRLRLKPNLGRTRLLLVPRHPERFDAVADVAARSGFPVKRRSQNAGGPAGAEIMVLDTLGELVTAYRFATVAFVGGTLVPQGGHSIIEPAWYAKPIVIGPSMDNFREIARDFRAKGAIRQIQATGSDREAQIKELTDEFTRLLENEELRTALGHTAYSVLENNRGAARFTVDKIAAIYSELRKENITS
jgi:3-deoxy-D-manno-octulosonic-acid transferase